MSHATQALNQNTANRNTTLDEEEVFDVSLSTFHVFDAENPALPARSRRLMPGGGGCGCSQGGCGSS